MIEIGDEIMELPVTHPVTGITIAADPPPRLSCPRCVLRIEEPMFRILIRASCSELQLVGTCRRCEKLISGRVRYYKEYNLVQGSYGWRRVGQRKARSKCGKWLDRLVDLIKRKL